MVVLAATNDAKVLDKALVRPGRFDTQVQVLLPDIHGRKEILKLYLDKLSSGNYLVIILMQYSAVTGSHHRSSTFCLNFNSTIQTI